MKTSNAHDQRIATMSFASVYPMYLAKVKKKGRTRDELHQVIQWLTGFDDGKLQELIEGKATFETFFAKARLNPNARFINGIICGYRVEDIENPPDAAGQVSGQAGRRTGPRPENGKDFAQRIAVWLPTLFINPHPVPKVFRCH